MGAKGITAIVIGVVVAALIVYDFWAYFKKDGATISEWFWRWSSKYPLIPFGVGVLCGHLFWQV